MEKTDTECSPTCTEALHHRGDERQTETATVIENMYTSYPFGKLRRGTRRSKKITNANPTTKLTQVEAI